MVEKYDFETVKNSETDPTVIKKGQWIVLMYSMSEDGGTYIEYPPNPKFYKVFKFFYPNGILKEMGKVTGQNFKFGIWQYFDEKGNFIKEEDEDKKLGRIKVNDILKFLEKEGWINLSTGEGREYPILKEKYVEIESCRFLLSFIQKGKDIPVTENDPPLLWVIRIPTAKWNNYYETTYYIDGDTGEVLKKKSIDSPIEI